MKIKLSTVLEVDVTKFPNIDKKAVREQIEGIFNSYIQQLELESLSLLADINAEVN